MGGSSSIATPDDDPPLDPAEIEAQLLAAIESDAEVESTDEADVAGGNDAEVAAPADSDDAAAADGAQPTPVEVEAPAAAAAATDIGVMAVGVPPGNPGNNQAKLIVRAGGDRTGTGNTSQTVNPLAGMTYQFHRTTNGGISGGTNLGTAGQCTTDATGMCGIITGLPEAGGGWFGNYDHFYAVAIDAPAGWLAPSSWSEGNNYRFESGPITRNGNASDRTVTLPPAGVSNRTVSNPTWANVRDNNPAPQQCGIDLAVVVDLSNSVANPTPANPSLLLQYKAAANEFVDALTGTPSRIALHTFATNAPANGPLNGSQALTSVATPGSASPVKARIDGFTPTTDSNDGGTNWDRGFHQIVESNEVYDVVMFLTDGAPTFQRNGLGPGSSTTNHEVNEAIHSANAVKALPNAPAVLAVGIGEGASTDAAANRLSLISGPEDGTDYFRTDFDELAETLRDIATASCGGSLTVVKQIVDADGDVVDDSPGGWEFTATSDDAILEGDSGLTGVLARDTDADTGAVNFGLDFGDNMTAARSVGVTETQQAGFELVEQGGQNAVCTADGANRTVTDAGALGFTVDVGPAEVVNCIVQNRELPPDYDDLVVSKTVLPAFDRDYDWQIEKLAREDRIEVPAGQDATFTYDVAVTPSEPADSGFAISGTITVENPNDIAISGVDVSDSLVDLPGATCAVTNGTGLTIDAGGSYDLHYSCTVIGATAATAGVNTATATWDAADYPGTTGTATTTADFDFAAAEPRVTDDVVVVTDTEIELEDYDDGTQVGNLVRAEDGATVFTYGMTWPSEPGQCVDHPNTATISNGPGANVARGIGPMAVSDSSTEIVTVCAGLDLDVEKNVVSSFDRTYLWTIDKVADETVVHADPATGTATFDYTVTATPILPPNGWTDSAWAMSGEITVSNPNEWLDITADVTDEVSVGGGAICTVAGGTAVTIGADESVTLDYLCTFTSQPSYSGTNTATATWADTVPTPNGSATGTADVAVAEWSVTPINDVVDVYDDKTDPDAEPVHLGEAEWNATGTPTVFTYSLDQQGTPGQCVDFDNRAWIQQTEQDADETVAACLTAPLQVSKTAAASFDRTYLWDIEKDVDRTTVTVDEETGEAEFDYTVSAVPGGAEDSGWTLDGQITVTNPNVFESATVTVTDAVNVGGGAVCVVVDGVDAQIAAGATEVFDYSCSFTDQPSYEGVNTATVVSDGETFTGTADVEFELDGETDKTVDVVDDKTDPTDPVVLGEATWNAAGTPVEFDYSLTHAGVPGQCVDFTNTAWLEVAGDDPTADQTVEVCVEAPLQVSKTAAASFDRTYLWDIEKDVDRTTVTVDEETGEADFEYVVAAIPNGFDDSGWTLDGQITVTNPNVFESATVTVTDAVNVGGGAVCEVVGGADAEIAAGATEVFDYSCSFTGEPSYEGVNTATVVSGGETFTGTADVEFELDGETDKTVDVVDDKTDPANPVVLGEATWNAAGTPVEFDYSLTHAGVPGQCVDFTNTAWLEVAGDDPTADQTVEVCVEAPLQVSKTAAASFDRTYLWDIEKDVDRTTVTVDEETGEADFEYVVAAIPNGFDDSGWTLDGQITVTNPNVFESATVTVTDAVNVGGGAVCEVVGGADAEIAAGATEVFDYSCSFTGEPSYEGVNTATVVSGGETFTGTADVEFELDGETDKTVDVVDDKTDPANPVVLGEATWNAAGTPVELPYSLTHVGVPGQCVDFTNTAWLEVAGQVPAAGQTVEVCVEAPLQVAKTAEASFDRTYLWDISKDVNRTTVEVDGSTASFNYTVRAVPSGFVDSGWTLDGEISVTNPNVFEPATVTVTDAVNVGGGAVCEVVGGADAEIAAGATEVFDYSCSFTGEPSYEGVNTATVVSDGETFTGTADVEFELDGETDKTVDVVDDKTDPANPVVLGEATWNAAGTPVELPYSLTHVGVPGQCVDFTNTAWLEVAGQVPAAGQTVEVCVEAPLQVAKTAEASFDRTYLWDISKDVNRTTVEVDGSTASFNYTVRAVPSGFVDSGWTLDGEISVTNPNVFEPATVTVTDAVNVGGGAVCEVVGGADAEIAAGATEVFDYSCSFTGEPSYEGVNTATVVSDGETFTGTADVEFELDGETDKTVDVVDDKTDPANPVSLGTATWNAASTPRTFTYPLTHEGVPGQCVDFTNTAWVAVTGDDPEAGVTVTVCAEDDITVVKTATASYDRLYGWDIDKSVDDTEIEVDEDGRATYTYLVDAVTDGFVDSDWEMAGTITVHNPNEYDDGAITVNVVDVTDVGATCAVEGGSNLILAPGATQTLDYSCTFDEEPEYEGTNTATVSWTGAGGNADEVSHTVPVEFAADVVTDLTIDVWDDKTDPTTPIYLGEATWTDEASHEFSYDVVHQGVGGQCVELTNTAWLDLAAGRGPDDSTTVELCVDSPVAHDKTAVSANQLDSGKWQVRYEIDVVNDAQFDAVYSLSDTLELGGGITPESAFWLLQGTATGGVWAGLPDETTTVIATDATIAAGSTHTYVVLVTADVAAGVVGSGAGQCSGDDGTDGGGFLNAARLTAGQQDETARDCLEPAAPETSKTAGDLVENADGTWTVSYELTATNPTADQDLHYSLVDQLDFAGGVSIVSATVSGAAGSPTPNTGWDGITNASVVEDEPISGGQSHTYAVTVVVDLSGDIADADRQCSTDVGGGTGLFNGSTLTSGNDDYDDDACVDIPEPTVEVGKTATSVGQNVDGSWTVTYEVVASNDTSLGGTYDLTDTLELGAGITPTVATWSLADPADAGEWTDPAAEPTATLATDRLLAGGDSHTYTVTVTAEVAAGVIGSEPGQCSGDGGTDGGGFLNAATLTAYGDPQTDRDCREPVAPSIDKTFETLTENADGTWDVVYTLDVVNPHPVTVAYDLVDEPAFVAGAAIEGASVVNTAPGDIVTNPGFDAVSDLAIVSGQVLTADSTHSYTVTVTVDLSGVTATDGAGARQCGDEGDRTDHGLYNDATITSGNDDYADDACVPVPDPTVEVAKSATSALQSSDGSWTVTYEVLATNTSSVGGAYDLTDTIEFGEGITPTAATWSLVDPVVEGEWADPATEPTATLAADRPLAGGDSHSYVVVVDATVAAGVIGSEPGQCSGDDGTDGGGFLNSVTLTAHGAESTDADCLEPALPDFDKLFGSAVQQGNATWDVTYTLVVDNSGNDSRAYYELTDAPHFAAGVTILGQSVNDVTDPAAPADIAWDGTSAIVEGAEVAAGDVHTYEVTFNVRVSAGIPAENLTCDPVEGEGYGFFNSAELSSGPDTIPGADCGDITESVVPTVTKTVTDGSPVQNVDGTWAIVYDVVVTTPVANTLTAVYELDDTIEFGEGITVSSAAIAAANGDTPAPLTTWTGVAPDTAVTDGEVVLPAGTTHTYTVTVQADVTEGVVGSEAGRCYTGEVPVAGGFLNTVTLTTDDVERYDDACAEPVAPSISKTFETLTENADGTWDVVYELDVVNPHDVGVAYDLVDEPVFATGVVIEGAAVVNTAPGDIATNPAFDAVSDLGIVSAQVLAAGTTHTYTVTVTVDLSAMTATDLSEDRVCGVNGSSAGHGLFNGATITSGNDEYSDDACVDIPDPTVEVAKTATSALQNSDGSWTVTYEVEASNTSSVGGAYDLTDTIDFGEGITPTAATWSLRDSELDGEWADPATEPTATLATDRPLAGGADHTYVVVVDATVAAGVIGSEPGQCSGDDGTGGGGFLNSVTLTAHGEESAAADCLEPALPDFEKLFGSAAQLPDTTWGVTYTLVVDNSGNLSRAFYDLADAPLFAEGVEILGQSVLDVTDVTTPVEIELDGTSAIVEGAEVAAGDVHTYEVTFNVRVSADIPAENLTCDPIEGAGSGFFNSATLTSGPDTIPGEDCGDITESVVPTVTKTVTDDSPVLNDDGTWTIDYDVVVTTPEANTLAAVYQLDDELVFGEGITVLGAAVVAGNGDTPDPLGSWTGLAPDIAVTDGEIVLPAGVSHMYTVSVDAGVADGVIGSVAGQCYTGEVPQAGGFLNTVTLTTDGIERTDDACAEPGPSPWTLSKTSDPVSGSQVDPGDVIEYTLTATPAGEYAPVGVQVQDDLADVLEHAAGYGDIVASTGTTSWDGDVLVWDIGTLAETATLTYSVVVDDDAWDVTLVNVVTGGSTPATCIGDCATTHTTPPRPDHPDLPTTGAQLRGWIAAALVLTLVGVALTTVRRRRQT
ncbi:hypothetical protein V2J52_07620 [Georgenia sp. MJ173]